MGSVIYPLLRYLEDGIKKENVTSHLSRLRRLKNADPEFIRDYQFKALKKLLDYAYQNVAFYRKRFDLQGALPADIKSFDDFARLKPVTRADIQQRGTELISKHYSMDTLMSGSSSGSTGEPIKFYHDRQAYSAGRAAVLMGWELAGKRMGDKVVTLWGNRETIETRWSKPGSRIKAKLYRDIRIPIDQLAEEPQFKKVLNIMNKQRGGYLFGYAHPIYMIASYAQENNIALEQKFTGVLTTAEKLYPKYRKIVEEVLGPVYDCYGSREILGMAFQCRERKGYHVIDPNLILEAEDFRQDTKEVIVTDLWNYAWPLIRYKIADLISGEFRTCTCGCTWKTIETIVGRTSDIIKLPDGSILHPLFWLVSPWTKYWIRFKQWQFARVAPDKLVLRVQIQDMTDTEFLDELTSALSQHFKGKIEFEAEVVTSFPIGPNGKSRSIVDETK